MNPTRKSVFPTAALVVLHVLAACSSGSDPEVICTTESRPALGVTATDNVTKEPIYGFTGTVLRADGFSQTATAHPTMGSLAFAFEGQEPVTGSYSVKVTKAGYQDWEVKDVIVSEDRCHVETVSLKAEMVPL